MTFGSSLNHDSLISLMSVMPSSISTGLKIIVQRTVEIAFLYLTIAEHSAALCTIAPNSKANSVLMSERGSTVDRITSLIDN
jgi:hypothetical protein